LACHGGRNTGAIGGGMIWRSSLFSKITVHETPIGGNVAAQIEVHDVVRFLQVVGPFEIEGEIGVSRWQAEGSAWSRKIRIILSSPAKNLLAVSPCSRSSLDCVRPICIARSTDG